METRIDALTLNPTDLRPFSQLALRARLTRRQQELRCRNSKDEVRDILTEAYTMMIYVSYR